MKKSSIWIVLTLLCCLIVFEFWFDVFEILTGKLLLITNSSRPQTGRLWVEENKEKSGDVAVDSLAGLVLPDTISTLHFSDIYDLHSELLLRKQVVLGRNTFKDFYRTIPVQSAKLLQDPMLFLEMYYNPNWESVKMILNGSQLSIYFLDGFGQPLNERYLNFNDLTKNTMQTVQSRLADKSEFKDRIVPANIFYKAFLALPVTYRLQIINDPYKLVSWGDNLTGVGISSTIEMGSVKIAFEIVSEYQTRIYPVNASEIAAGYLINMINDQSEKLHISKPVSREY